MEINNIEKQPKIRNASGISAYNKDYYKQYAQERNKQMIRCDDCNMDISYYAMHRHKKSKRHLKNCEPK